MAQWITVLLAVAAATIALVDSRAIPAEPISVMLDPYGNPIVFLREKRTAVHPYPQRAMMFTGYYRPVRRTGNGGQATGVFAQGNAVSGEAFFGGVQAPRLKGGPEPIEEQEVSSAEAHAAPADDGYNEEDGPLPEDAHHPEEQQPEPNRHPEDRPFPGLKDEHHDPQQQEQEEEQQTPDGFPVQAEQAADPAPGFTTEAAVPEEPSAPTTKATVTRPKVHLVKKPKKPVVDEVEDEDEDDEEDEPVVPFVPFNKGSRRRQNYPHLNNFFPMVFSFPGVSTRSGSSGTPPGAVTAIANSYSTGKGGVASSVATAYGGSPNGKKRRPQAEE